MFGPRQTWLLALGVMVVAAAASVPFRHLWEPDEPRYCQSAREMIASGDWILPHLNGQPYGHKPPLFMWLVAAGRLAGLGWTAAGVLPSLLPFLTLVLVMPRMARDMGLARPTGELAGAFLAASLLAAVMALAARMDTLFAVLLTLALWLTGRLLWPGGGVKRRDHLLLWIVLALATLTKGPVALVLFAFTVAITALVATPRPRLAPLLRGPGPAVALLLLLAWVAAAGLRGGPDFLHEILIRQSTGRTVDSFAHKRPFYYHLMTYPVTGLPFAFVSLFAAFLALRRRSSHPTILLAAAMVAVLGFFSVISGKLVVYLLPLFPAAALLAADAVASERRGVRSGLWLGSVGMTLVGTGVAVAPWLRPELAPVKGPLLIAGGVVTTLAAAAAAALIRRQETLVVAVRLATAGLAVPFAVFPIATRALDRTMHLATVAAAVKEMEPNASDGFVFRMNVSGPSLYGERIFRKLRTPEELAAVLSSGRVVITEEKSWRRIGGKLAGLAVRATVFEFRTGPVFVLRAATAADSAATPPSSSAADPPLPTTPSGP